MDSSDLRDVLLARAEADPGAIAYEYVEPGRATDVLTRAQVVARASALGRELARCPEGPVMVACPAGPDYAVAVLAGFLAGRPVVPAFPPGPSATPDRGRLAGMIADARPVAVVAAQAYPEFSGPTLAVPGAEADGEPWLAPDLTQDVAIVQYTSGSTGHPKGVLVRHEGVAANTAAIAERFGLTVSSRAITWLPPFHDMGLVGGLLTPIRAGIPVRILRPGDFLKAPLWWLRQIGESGATASGGPDFAYDLCVRRARDDAALDGLDLSGWRVAFTGGEPVRHRTLTAFAERFAAAGFRPDAFLPCYGLAEATLMVSAGHWSGSGDPAVSCGRPVPGQRVAVVDGDTGSAVADGAEGEIWVAGPHITPGHLAGDDDGLFGELDGGRYLRTGDLGTLSDGELRVTGRVKDVLVVHGANHHAVDLEAAALVAAGRVARAAAAFLVDGPDPLPVVVLELQGHRDEDLAARVRAAVLASTGLRPAAVVLVPPRAVPRTSSGKVRRSACRDAFLAGTLPGTVTVGDRAALAALAGHRSRVAAAGALADLVAGVLGAVADAAACGPDSDLGLLAVDSIGAAEAAAVLEDALGLPVPLESVLGVPTPRDIADVLLTRWTGSGHDTDGVSARIMALDAREPEPAPAFEAGSDHRAGVA